MSVLISFYKKKLNDTNQIRTIILKQTICKKINNFKVKAIITQLISFKLSFDFIFELKRGDC